MAIATKRRPDFPFGVGAYTSRGYTAVYTVIMKLIMGLSDGVGFNGDGANKRALLSLSGGQPTITPWTHGPDRSLRLVATPRSG